MEGRHSLFISFEESIRAQHKQIANDEIDPITKRHIATKGPGFLFCLYGPKPEGPYCERLSQRPWLDATKLAN